MNVNEKILVSVCMITYNHERYIQQAIEGVMMQVCSYPFQLVLGEDCSTDNTRKICEEFTKTNNRIRLLPKKQNLGITKNFIRTLEACQSKYIALCEGDDYWTDPHKLQKQIDFLEANPEYGLVHSGFEVHDVDDNLIGIKKPDYWKGHIFFAMQKRPIVSTLTSVIRQEALKPLIKRIMTEHLGFTIDIWFWQHIALKWKIHYFSDITAVYRIHPGGVTKRKGGLGCSGGFITLDIYNTFFTESKIPIPIMDKLVMATKYCQAYLGILKHEKGNKYRDIANNIFSKQPWLIIGLVPALLGKLARLPKKLATRLYEG